MLSSEGRDVGDRIEGRRSVWLPVVVASLVVVECALVGEVGSPTTLLRALGDLGGDAWADPVVSVLSLMALVAELLAGYVLAVLVLRWLCMLPGSAGRTAGRIAFLVTPLVVRRLLDLLVGGTLLAHVTLAATPAWPATPAGDGSRTPSPVAATASLSSGLPGPAVAGGLTPSSVELPRQPPWPVQAMEPVPARPTPRRSAVPLPPWLGGGPSNPPPVPSGRTAAGHIVEVGDTLWDIAAAHLPATERSAASIQRYWRQIFWANRAVIGADPDLVHPGTRLHLPPFPRDRR
jgi:hypothetical protein